LLQKGGIGTTGKPIVKEILDWALHIGLAVLIGILIVTFIGQRTIVYGNSMQPTLQQGDQLIVEKISPRLNKLNRGDIVTVYVPDELDAGKDTIIKRIVGVAGDTVEIKLGKVYVNGKELQEDYTKGDRTRPVNEEYSNVTVPRGYVYVLGDNRLPNASKDSRSIGPVEIGRIRGKAVLRYYPFNKFGTANL
jgi:signal peptidase I